MSRHRASAVVPVAAFLAVGATCAGGGSHDVISPESAALLMPVLQESAAGKLDMNTFWYRRVSDTNEAAWAETERVLQSDGALRWRYLYCSTTSYPGFPWQCKPVLHRALRVAVGDGGSSDILIDEDIDAAEARAALTAVIRELGKLKPITPCNPGDKAASGSLLLEEIRHMGEVQLHRVGREYSLGRFATAYFGFEAGRKPQVEFRCLKLGDVLEE